MRTSIVTRADMVRSLSGTNGPETTVLDAGTREVIVAYPDELVHETASRMVQHNIGRLLVVDRDNPFKLIAYIGRPGILCSRVRHHEEENVLESIWIAASA